MNELILTILLVLGQATLSFHGHCVRCEVAFRLLIGSEDTCGLCILDLEHS